MEFGPPKWVGGGNNLGKVRYPWVHTSDCFSSSDRLLRGGCLPRSTLPTAYLPTVSCQAASARPYLDFLECLPIPTGAPGEPQQYRPLCDNYLPYYVGFLRASSTYRVSPSIVPKEFNVVFFIKTPPSVSSWRYLDSFALNETHQTPRKCAHAYTSSQYAGTEGKTTGTFDYPLESAAFGPWPTLRRFHNKVQTD